SIGQTFRNLNFANKCDTFKTGLCYWDLSWGGKGAVVPANNGGINCMLIVSKREGSVGFAEQASAFPVPKGDEFITLTATIRTDSVVGKGAGLNLWLLDASGNSLISKDMGGVYSLDWVRGSTEWKTYSVSVFCPKETAKVKIGAILHGKGKAWFSDYKFSVTPVANRKASTLAVKYINAACAIIQKHSLFKDSVNIDKLKQTALKIAGPAKNYSDCFLAVNYLVDCLRLYGDNHLFFMKAAERKNWEQNGSAIHPVENATCKIVDGYGYILVPGFHSGNKKLICAFAENLQAEIKRLSQAGIKGWIVDLRGNSGGNQEPMIAGLGPLFSAVKLGSLVDVNHQYSSWNYDHGLYFFDDDKTNGWKIPNPVTLTSQLPIAVLTNGQAGSSGEIATISFVGNARTKSFGQPTMGLTTGNGSFDLPDGSQMFIASTHMVDRNGKIYTGPVVPDVLVEVGKDGKRDNVLETAENWLARQ
ncbi:MAG: S41 family peptidase, partial [Mucilaginibacter sp.]